MSAEGNDDLYGLSDSQMTRKLARDVYFGNGKPALTVRMALLEGEMTTVHSNIDEIKSGQRAATKMMISTLISSIMALIGICVEIALHSK